MPDIDGVELVEGGSGKREVGDAVDLPWQAARGLEQGLDRGRLEQRQFAAGQVQPVQQVGLKFVAQQTACCISLCFDKILQIIPMQGRGILWINSLLQERVTVASLTETYGSTGPLPGLNSLLQ